jgi:pimeloyl-ACP methyl ester carboxylesterase
MWYNFYKSCEVAPMPTIVIEGVRIYYQQQGQGRPLLMLHCGLGTGGDFAAILPALAERYLVITPDRPGYGQSDHEIPFDERYFTAQAHWMDCFLAALGIATAGLWGWSDGGVVALGMAIRHPTRVRALVVEAGHLRGRKPETMDSTARPASGPPAAPTGTAFIAQHLRPAGLPAEERARLARQHGAEYGPVLAQKWARFWLDLGRRDAALYDGRLREVRVPALVLHAADDPYVPVEEAEGLAAAIPTARLRLFPEGGHAIHAGPARTAFLATALAFLQEVTA